MKYVVVDGLRETRLYYKDKIIDIDKNAEVFQCMSAEDAIFVIFDKKPDVIIASEILSFRSGFELARLLKKLKLKLPIIIIANDASNALDAIKNDVFEFIVQPIIDEIFIAAIEKAIVYIEENIRLNICKRFKNNVKIRLSTSNGYRLIDLNQLAYCMADGSYTNIYFTNGKFDFSSYYLGKIEKTLLDYHFVRINRSAIINLKLIKSIDKKRELCFLEVGDKIVELKISKSNLKKLEEERIL